MPRWFAVAKRAHAHRESAGPLSGSSLRVVGTRDLAPFLHVIRCFYKLAARERAPSNSIPRWTGFALLFLYCTLWKSYRNDWRLFSADIWLDYSAVIDAWQIYWNVKRKIRVTWWIAFLAGNPHFANPQVEYLIIFYHICAECFSTFYCTHVRSIYIYRLGRPGQNGPVGRNRISHAFLDRTAR